MKSFISQLEKRRSIYALNKNLPVSEKEVTEIIERVVRQAPSSFNSQSSRVVILFGKEHDNMWKTVIEGMKRVGVSGDALKAAEQKVNGCLASGAGTILFFEDQKVVRDLQKKMPLYADNFPGFSRESSAIAQYAVWTTLAQGNIGASLQHYNELIEEDLKKQHGLPADWKLTAQMPFGGIAAPAGEKTFIPDEGRFIAKL
ncbi:nitroreductase [Angomonas deanei]|uniref:Nitroreductase family, putative n=1 Tax=Angomonas deanei TaxID=59799 RepID=A0A7G2CGV6_9TRYP|nr:nitroreductase [Angomonas deanei]CAD2218201.1 Nitroreductase family, putative [Angomonas deanei]|eukprot:EPY14964.1 nitroreductase [Angomonas deanei]